MPKSLRPTSRDHLEAIFKRARLSRQPQTSVRQTTKSHAKTAPSSPLARPPISIHTSPHVPDDAPLEQRLFIGRLLAAPFVFDTSSIISDENCRWIFDGYINIHAYLANVCQEEGDEIVCLSNNRITSAIQRKGIKVVKRFIIIGPEILVERFAKSR